MWWSSGLTSKKYWSAPAGDAACRASPVPPPPSWLVLSPTATAVPEDGRREEIDVAKNIGTSSSPLGGARIRVHVQQASETDRPCKRISQPITGTEVLGDPSFPEPVGEQPGGKVGGA